MQAELAVLDLDSVEREDQVVLALVVVSDLDLDSDLADLELDLDRELSPTKALLSQLPLVISLHHLSKQCIHLHLSYSASKKTPSNSGNRFGAGSGKVSQGISVPAVPPRVLPQKVKTPTFSPISSGTGKGFDRIKEQVKQYNNDGYYYRYLTEQDAQVAETGRLEDRDTDNETLRAKGFYEYVGDDGVRYRVDYNADENGFVPRGAHLPTPPPIPEAILRALEYVRSVQQ